MLVRRVRVLLLVLTALAVTAGAFVYETEAEELQEVTYYLEQDPAARPVLEQLAAFGRLVESEKSRAEYEAAIAYWQYVAFLQASSYPPGQCGGDLPPCSVMNRESGGNIRAENPSSSAAGKWQMLIGTSNNCARAMGRFDLVGVPASHWTEEEQDTAARILWAGGAGRSHWSQTL